MSDQYDPKSRQRDIDDIAEPESSIATVQQGARKPPHWPAMVAPMVQWLATVSAMILEVGAMKLTVLSAKQHPLSGPLASLPAIGLSFVLGVVAAISIALQRRGAGPEGWSPSPFYYLYVVPYLNLFVSSAYLVQWYLGKPVEQSTETHGASDNEL